MKKIKIDKFAGKTIERFDNAGFGDDVGDFTIVFTDGTAVSFNSCGCCGGIRMESDVIIKEVKEYNAEQVRQQKINEEALAAKQREQGLIA